MVSTSDYLVFYINRNNIDAIVEIKIVPKNPKEK